ncbi:ABC transporter permease [bacterium AH-315-P07]|nr:ABC transporter permease [bacterium AH-315-P07]
MNWYFFKRTVRLGVKSLWLHKLRSGLTVLGLVFGVSSVIAMLAVGEGASHEAQEQIRQQGSHNIILKSVKPPESEEGNKSQTYMVEYGITEKDLQRIRATIPTVEILVPNRIIRKKVWNVGHRTDCDVVGTVPWYPEMRNHRVASGRYFTDAEMERRGNVCVLGAEVVQGLFPLHAAIGRSVRIGSDYYEVIGVMEPLGRGPTKTDAGTAESNTGLQTETKRVYIPLSVARTRFGEILVKQSSGSREVERVEYHEVTVKVSSLDKVIDTSLIITDLIDLHHEKPDVEITVPLDLLIAAEKTARIFNMVLGSIATISLVVGGIGIMNIMLASVTERTREIGIRRALGAKRRDIILQFLIETVLLSAVGGALGVVLGVSIPSMITYFADQVTIVKPWSPALAFAISAVVGVVFGLYPAIRAADMDPVEALRHE